MGQLALLVHDGVMPEGIDIEIEHDYNNFNVVLDDYHGLLYIPSMIVLINKYDINVGTRYNSKDNYPLECVTHDISIVQVLNEQGKFDQEFIDHFTKDNNENI